MLNTDNITINTHSSIRIEGSKVIYFDPFEIADDKHDADVIFVTHDHYDHFDVRSIGCIAKADTIIVAPESIARQVVAKAGIAESNCVFMEPDSLATVEGLEVEAVPSYNRMKPFHPKGKKYLGFVVAMDGVRYYVAGDTDVNDDIVKVKCDVALVPVGGTYTMDAKAAAELIAQIKPQVAIPTHYGSIAGKGGDGLKFAEKVTEKNTDGSGEITVQIKL